jgi:hypothetical protein
LFDFYDGEKYNGKTFYAVTPEFINKCETRLLSKGKTEFNFEKFKLLPKFQLSPLEKDSLRMLGIKIIETYGIAYNKLDISNNAKISKLFTNWLNESASVRIEDRTRLSVKSIVEKLDAVFQEQE